MPAAPTSIPVLDPLCKAGFIHVPLLLTQPTKGRADWIAAGGCLMRDLSVCCLYQDNRCRAGTGCRQIHCERGFIAEERERLASVVVCCRDCGDSATVAHDGASDAYGVLATRADDVSVSFSGPATLGMPTLAFGELAFTAGLNPVLLGRGATSCIDLPWASVCRLHLKSQCKFGRDCKNVHVCTKRGKELLIIAANNANGLSIQAPVPAAPPASVRRASVSSTSAEDFFAERQQSVSTVADAASPLLTVGTIGMPDTPRMSQLPALKAPLPLRAKFPRLDEGSLQLRDVDLDGLVFNLPTLHSAVSTDSRLPAELCDIFGATPTHCCDAASVASFASPMAALLSVMAGGSSPVALAPACAQRGSYSGSILRA